VIQGDYQGALPLIQESLSIRRTKTGKRTIGGSQKQQLQDDEFGIMMGLSELGVVYYGLGEFGAALQVWREALQMSCQALGYEHYEVARLLNNIGCLHFETGKLVAALATFEESLDIAQGTLGKRSPQHADMALLNVATTLCNVGMVSIRRNQYDAAISLLEEGLMVQESVLDDDHTIAQTTSNALSLLQRLQTENKSTSDNNSNSNNNTSLNQLDTLQMLEEKLGNHSSAKNTVSDTNTESTCATTSNSTDDGPTTVHDKIDWITLGPLHRELSLRQRIRASILKDFSFESLDTSYDSENVQILMEKVLQHLKVSIHMYYYD
jgi:tetratricopeptide (TPR) repeat protein